MTGRRSGSSRSGSARFAGTLRERHSREARFQSGNRRASFVIRRGASLPGNAGESWVPQVWQSGVFVGGPEGNTPVIGGAARLLERRAAAQEFVKFSPPGQPGLRGAIKRNAGAQRMKQIPDEARHFESSPRRALSPIAQSVYNGAVSILRRRLEGRRLHADDRRFRRFAMRPIEPT